MATEQPGEPHPMPLNSNLSGHTVATDAVEDALQNSGKMDHLCPTRQSVDRQTDHSALKEDGNSKIGGIEVYPSTIPLAFICLGLILAMFLVSLDMTIVATAIPRITDQFKSLDQVGFPSPLTIQLLIVALFRLVGMEAPSS